MLLLIKTNRSSRSSPSTWITSDILNLKSARRQLECIYINNHSVLPKMFANYFADNISKPHLNLQTNPSSTTAYFLPSTAPVLHHFTPAIISEVSDLLSQSPNSHCSIDHISTIGVREIYTYTSTIVLANTSKVDYSGAHPNP